MTLQLESGRRKDEQSLKKAFWPAGFLAIAEQALFQNLLAASRKRHTDVIFDTKIVPLKNTSSAIRFETVHVLASRAMRREDIDMHARASFMHA